MASIAYRIQSRLRKSSDWLRGWYHAYITLLWHKFLRKPIRDLNTFERRIAFIERQEFSQNGEDGIINALFTMIGTTNKYFVEFGVEDGLQCNTRYLWKKHRWKGLLMDGDHENSSMNLHKEFITAENIESLFAKYEVPRIFDLLSIDIDGNDYWIWKAITHYEPRVVIIEYNACFPWQESKTIPYDASFVWDKTDYYGATLQALVRLGETKGYTLVATDSCGVNAFFVQNELVPGNFAVSQPEYFYHPAAFKGRKGNKHPMDTQKRAWTMI
ncbi:MAG: hypothetical protein WCX61_02660 [Candidatus Peribacteraceae bacterium]